ncbi:hypothetical protein [Lysobacter solisilvae (ex Woo and Kim 2020)]|uniref:Uncharacterized protein n=1 Tax=Agrilutibacter terrestris TaxID=2865112 RepID=A0A7H0G0N9_9GAMM|nr:hypothetical protein [Lysobacter terrestris]QNP41855.1 hypothetical protein H8B22_06575 [Lysobacter terrestris]
MNIRNLALSLSLSVVVLAAATAQANVGKLGLIRQQQQDIREESERATGRYARFDRYELERMHRAQDRIFQLLDGVTELDQLNAADKAELLNALETVKAVITQNDEDRQVCWREKTLGSHRFQTHCATVRERAQVREGGKDWHGSPTICGQTPGPSMTITCGRVRE